MEGRGARRPWMSRGPGTEGVEGEEQGGGSRQGPTPRAVPTPPWQGPFVHLSVMIAAYLGRVRAKATGESEVRGSWGPPPLEE